MKEEGRMVTIHIEFHKDLDLLDAEKRKLTSYYTNRGLSTYHAEIRAKNEISLSNCSQTLTIREYPETAPLSDVVFDIAKGRLHKFSVETIN